MLFNPTTPEVDKCEACGTTEQVVLGNWMFHCPTHKANDLIAEYDEVLALPVSSNDIPFLLV
jgi:hypothetical protein